MEETLAAMEEFEPEGKSHFLEPCSKRATEETVKDSHLEPHKSAVPGRSLILTGRSYRDKKESIILLSTLQVPEATSLDNHDGNGKYLSQFRQL